MLLFKQKTDYTCGPACILMAISHFRKVSESEEYIAKIAKSNNDIGTSRYKMISTARMLGFKVSSGIGASLEDIKKHLKANRPVIVLYKDVPDSFHYSLIVDIGENVTVADPWYGEKRKIALTSFTESWVCHNNSKSWWMTLRT